MKYVKSTVCTKSFVTHIPSGLLSSSRRETEQEMRFRPRDNSHIFY